MIILKVTENQGFNLSLEDTFFRKTKNRFRVNVSRFGMQQKSHNIVSIFYLQMHCAIFFKSFTLL